MKFLFGNALLFISLFILIPLLTNESIREELARFEIIFMLSHISILGVVFGITLILKGLHEDSMEGNNGS